MDLVAYDPAYSDIARSLLSDVVVVENLEAARAVVSQRSPTDTTSGRLVTLQGEIVEFSGLMVGGTAEGGGLLASKREIRELKDEVVLIESELVRPLKNRKLWSRNGCNWRLIFSNSIKKFEQRKSKRLNCPKTAKQPMRSLDV